MTHSAAAEVAAATGTAATNLPDPYGWEETDTFHDVVGKSEEILQLEKAHHLHYLLEYRVRQCPLFLLGNSADAEGERVSACNELSWVVVVVGLLNVG